MAENEIDWARLVSYDPSNGIFRWIEAGKGRTVGAVAGFASRGKPPYWQLKHAGKWYPAHRVAWFLVHGEWPKGILDHKNGNSLDNRISNLREATFSENAMNRPGKPQANVPYKGVWLRKNKYVAEIAINRKRMHLGVFDTAEAAHTAYSAAAAKHHGEFSRTR